MAMDILLQLEKSKLDDEVLSFALSQTGDLFTRFAAIMRLIHTGRYTGAKNVMLWDELRGNWREVELDTQPIGTLPAKAKPATIEFIEKTEKAAIALLQKAMILEPGSPVPVFNL